MTAADKLTPLKNLYTCASSACASLAVSSPAIRQGTRLVVVVRFRVGFARESGYWRLFRVHCCTASVIFFGRKTVAAMAATLPAPLLPMSFIS